MGDQPEHDETEEASAPPPGHAERGGNAEAARYRRRLREVETERDALTERLAVLRRAEVERLASAHLAHAPDLWSAGVELGELLDEHGDVDEASVAAVASLLTQTRPHWRAGQASPDPDQGRRSDSAPVSWSQIITGR